MTDAQTRKFFDDMMDPAKQKKYLEWIEAQEDKIDEEEPKENTYTYVFRRFSRGKEYAYMADNNPSSIGWEDIIDHEDFEWEDWELVDTLED